MRSDRLLSAVCKVSHFAFVAGIALNLCILPGCGHRLPDTAVESQRALEDFKRQANELYNAYLTGDVVQAKQSLEMAIRLAETSELPPHHQAGSLYFDYARLYVLERRMGKDTLADAALVKARYWSLREVELGGNSADEAAAFIKSQTGDIIMGFIGKWDEDHTDGKGAKYLRQQ